MDINVDQLWHDTLLVEQDGKLAFTDMCRLCGSSSLNLISLCGDEGLGNDLQSKIDVYLPIQVSESDNLPHKVCSHCASTLVSWHELMLNCVKIDEKLREILRSVNVQSSGEFEHFDENISCLIEDEANLNASLVCEGSEKLKNGKEPAVPLTPTDDEVHRLMAPDNSKEAQQCHSPEWVEYTEWENKVIFATGNKTMFHCAHCEMAFGSRKELNVHLSRKHSVFVQYCENCGKLFCTRKVNSNDNSHTNLKLPSNFKKGQNDKNVPVLKDDHSYCSGQTVVKKSKEIDMTCDVCSSSFSGKQELLQHLQSHEFKVVELKDKSGSTLQKFEHIKVSKLEKSVRCDKCKKNFCSKDSYQRHYRIHTGEKPYTCDVCGKQFRDGGGLRRHLRDVHDRIKSFGCDICGRFFASKATRDDHRRIHTGERPYICHCCGKTFKSKASLFTHSKTHTNHFPFPCSHCTKSFRRRQELLNHTTVHTGEKPHVCEICGKNFRVKAEMLRHKITHSDDKPFVCEICGLSFKQRRYLRNHKKTHLKTIS